MSLTKTYVPITSPLPFWAAYRQVCSRPLCTWSDCFSLSVQRFLQPLPSSRTPRPFCPIWRIADLCWCIWKRRQEVGVEFPKRDDSPCDYIRTRLNSNMAWDGGLLFRNDCRWWAGISYPVESTCETEQSFNISACKHPCAITFVSRLQTTLIRPYPHDMQPITLLSRST